MELLNLYLNQRADKNIKARRAASVELQNGTSKLNYTRLDPLIKKIENYKAREENRTQREKEQVCACVCACLSICVWLHSEDLFMCVRACVRASE